MQPAKEHHDEHRARQQDQHQFKRVAHSEVLVFLGSRGEKCGIGLIYSPAYDKGCSRRRPASISPMNDRSKKAISSPALELARKVLAIEADAGSGLISRLDERLVDAVGLILACRGRVVVSGVGKSGHIARKIASTQASTGTPAFFVHAAEAGHGDVGRKFLTHVSEVMRTGADVPAVYDTDSFSDMLAEISRKSMGMTAILDRGKKVVGIFTDGDLRRTLESKPDIRGLKTADVMKRNPRTISPHKLAAEALELMERYKINQLLVATETGELVGALNMHDLFRAKVI